MPRSGKSKMARDDGKFWGWLLLGFAAYVVLKSQASTPMQKMKEAIMSQATLPEVRRKAASLTKGCTDEISRIDRLFRFVTDQIDYMPDPWNEDYFAKALETVYVGAGDCDCKSILLATLLRASGFKVALDFVPGHVLVEACINASNIPLIPANAYWRNDPQNRAVWILLDSTAAGAHIGWLDSQLYQQWFSKAAEQRIEI